MQKYIIALSKIEKKFRISVTCATLSEGQRTVKAMVLIVGAAGFIFKVNSLFSHEITCSNQFQLKLAMYNEGCF